MVLDSEPTATVTVTVAGHAGTDVTRTPGTLTFTTSNWDTVQTVTVTAGDDAETTDDSFTLTHSAASTDTGYSGIMIAGVVVTVRDNDTAQVTGVTVDAGDARLVVNWTAVGNAMGYKVQWKSGSQNYNTGNRQATVTSGATTSYTIRNLTNGTAYTVRVSATRTGANDGPPSAGVTKTPEANTSTNTDPLTLTVEAVQDTVTEGEPVRYRIVMSKPTRGVEVEAVYRYRGEFLRHDPSSTLTGIRSRRGVLYWEVERQTLDDAVDEADGRFTVRLQPGDGYQLGTPSVARVTIRDNDPEAVSPPVVSVADATVEEGMGPLAFRVTLDRAPLEEVSVAWETLEGRAKGRGLGKDYEAATGTLTFRPGETVKTVNVTVINDVVDEGQETMALYLWNPVGVVIADAVAKGTIKNSDPLPLALMGRFGRTAAVHVVERVEARMAAPRTVGVEAQFAGREVRPGMEREMALDFLRQLGASAGRHAPDGGSSGTLSGSPMAAAAGSMGLAAGMGRPAGGAMGLAAGPMDGRASPDGGLFDRGLASMGLGGGNLFTVDVNSSPPTSGSSPSRTRSSCGIDSPNCVRFEARGLQTGAVTIRDLVKHALRHRPDHIVVGEVRGGEAADLLQALNTGHGGSLTTVHANNAESALSRLASCAMQGGGDLPWEVTCRGRGGRDRHGDPHDPRRRPALRNWKSGPDSATKMEISDSFAGRSALALSFVPIRRGDHARCT